MRNFRLIMFVALAMLLANISNQVVCADYPTTDITDPVPHSTSSFEIVTGTLKTGNLQSIEEFGLPTLNVLTEETAASNHDLVINFETIIDTEADFFSLNLRQWLAVRVPATAFATQTAATDKIKNWITNEFDEISDFDSIPADLYAEPGTGNVVIQVSRSYAEAAEVPFDVVTWSSWSTLPTTGLGDATANSLVLAPNGDDVFSIYGQSNARIQTILPGVDLTCIPRDGRGILVAPDVVWRAWHNKGGVGSSYTFVDNFGNTYKAKALSFSPKIGGDGVLVKIKWVDGTGATIPAPLEIEPALVPPADFPCLLGRRTNLAGYRVEYTGGHRLTAGSYFFKETSGSAVFDLDQSFDLPSDIWCEAIGGDSGGAMFVVVNGKVVAMGGAWNVLEQGTAILRHLDALEAMSSDHEYVDLTEFRGFLLGDVNLDGLVSFLDIPSLIAVLQSGDFQAEADCNMDGVVNFFDISPFIEILNAQ